MTLDRVVLDVSEKEFCSGLQYVAVSRTKKLSGIMFEVPFDFDTLQKPGSGTGAVTTLRRQDWERRTNQMVDVNEMLGAGHINAGNLDHFGFW